MFFLKLTLYSLKDHFDLDIGILWRREVLEKQLRRSENMTKTIKYFHINVLGSIEFLNDFLTNIVEVLEIIKHVLYYF